MDTELKEKWATALESGEYQQGNGSLRRDGLFCCLGVLCDITQRGEWIDNGDSGFAYYLPDQPDQDLMDAEEYEEFDEDDWYNAVELPKTLLREIDLSEDIQYELIRRNDGTGVFTNKSLAFPEIAAFIRETL